jgi:hypothetical protein
LVIDAEGTLEWLEAVGIDTSLFDIQVVIQILDDTGFHVINPNAELTEMGLDPDTIRDALIGMGIDDDDVLMTIVDPNVDIDTDAVMAMVDATYNPSELIDYLDVLATEFGDLGNDDISRDLKDLEKDVRKTVEKR